MAVLTVLVVGFAVVAVLACAGVVALALVLRRQGRMLAEERVAASAALDRLELRVEELTGRAPGASPVVEESGYLITSAGEAQLLPMVPDRVVLSASLGEPLLRTVAFGHGVRRALSARSLNRIRFEMRREVRRSRRDRRRHSRESWRRLRAEGVGETT